MSLESLPRRDVARPVLRRAFTLAWTIGALLGMAIVVTAAGAASSVPDPARCTVLDDGAARLACFDALFPRAGRMSAANGAGAGRAAAPAAPEAAFGENEGVRRARGEDLASDAAPARIESTLTRLDPLEPGRVRLTLANGQVWEQVEPSMRFQPRAGETITVRQAALGSYLMRGSRGAAVRARRLR